MSHALCFQERFHKIPLNNAVGIGFVDSFRRSGVILIQKECNSGGPSTACTNSNHRIVLQQKLQSPRKNSRPYKPNMFEIEYVLVSLFKYIAEYLNFVRNNVQNHRWFPLQDTI